MAGDREVNRANADLAKTQLDYTLSRNREADQLAKERWDLQRPGMQVEAEQNRSRLERWKKPLTVGNVFGGTHGSEIAVFSKPGEPQRNANVYQFGRNVFSAEYDDEGGVWVKPDGSVVTEGDLELNKDKAAAWVDSVHDVHKMFNEKAMRLKDLLDANKIKKEDYDKGIAALTDPQTRYNELSKQLERVNQWAPMLPGIAAEKKAKIQNDMAALENAMAEKAAKEREYEFRAKDSALDRQNRLDVANAPGSEQKLLEALNKDPALAESFKKLQELKATKTDTKGSFQKDAEFLARAKGIPVDQAADIIRGDKALAQILRAYNEEVESLDRLGTMEPAERQMMQARVAKKYGVDKILGNIVGTTQQQGVQLDKDTATSILKEAGGDKAKAREIAKSRGYSF
jgi:hypothetical protein